MEQEYKNVYTKEIVTTSYSERVKTVPEAYSVMGFYAYVLSNGEIWETNLFKKYWLPLEESNE